MPRITDPRVVRLMESRGFISEPAQRRVGYDNEDRRISCFRRRVHDTDQTPHNVVVYFDYGYREEGPSIPRRIRVNTDEVPYRYSIRINGSNKWIAKLDDAITASIALARVHMMHNSKIYKQVAKRRLEGDVHYVYDPNNTGPAPAPPVGTDNH